METRLNTIKLNMENTGIFGSEIRRNLMVYKYQVLMASISQVFNHQIVYSCSQANAATQGQSTQVAN